MTHFIKKIVLLATVCCLTLFTGCQDDEHAHNHNEGKVQGHDYGIRERKITLNDINAMPQAKSKLDNIIDANKATIANRGV